MRIALCSLSVPWEGRVRLGVYNVRQAAALTEIGAPTRVFALAPKAPAPLRWVSPALRAAATRPVAYTFHGAEVRTVRGWIPPPPALHGRLGKRAPRLAAGLLARGLGAPLARAVQAFQPDIALYHNPVFFGELAKRITAATDVPHAMIEHNLVDYEPGSKAAAHFLDSIREARHLFVVGEASLRGARETLGIENVSLVRNGAALPTEEQRRAPRPDRWRGRRVVLCASSYVERKGHRELLEAFARAGVDDAALVLVGTPPEWVRQKIDRLGIARQVEVLPSVPQEELLQLMVWADLFALPSWAEPFGLVYVEAMGAGTPVIMTEDNGVRPYITPGEHGWVVPPRDVESLADALREALLTGDLASMGEAGRRLVEGEFTWKRNAEQVVEALQGVGALRRGGSAEQAPTPQTYAGS